MTVFAVVAVVVSGGLFACQPRDAKQAAADEERAVQASAAQAAGEARTTCSPLIHHNTLVFEDCVRDLAEHARADPARQLGIVYFGWVGAMNAARMGLQGSADTAARFLAWQAPLQIGSSHGRPAPVPDHRGGLRCPDCATLGASVVAPEAAAQTRRSRPRPLRRVARLRPRRAGLEFAT